MAEREAAHGELSHPLDPRLEAALDERGLLPLYSHQARAVDAALSGRDVALSTPTASGKSLCYHVPVAQAMLTDPSARALYLFPTKALTQDQLRGLRSLLPTKLAARVAIFDGDTPTGERSAVRRSAQAVFTNPDMLHVGMLPHHRTWARLWQSLRYVVIDEMHVYRGVFGSHVANVHAAAPQAVRALRQRSRLHPLLRHHRQSRRTCGAPDRQTGGGDRGRRRAPRGEALRLLEPAGRPRGDTYPGGQHVVCAAGDAREARGADARVRAHAAAGGGRLPGRPQTPRPRRRRTGGARSTLPRLVPAGGAPRGGAGDAQRRPDGRRRDERAGAGHRHRRAGYDRPHRLSGKRREHVAAGRAQRTHARGRAEHPRGARRPARPVPHAPPGLRLRTLARARAHTAGQPVRAGPPPEGRGV